MREMRGTGKMAILAILLVVTLASMAFSHLAYSDASSSGYVITGSKVSWEKENVGSIRVYPHTGKAFPGSAVCQYANVTSWLPSQNLDFAFKFPVSETVTGKKIWVWTSYDHNDGAYWGNKTYSYTCTGNHFNYTINPNWGECWEMNASNGTAELLFSHTFDRGHLPSQTIYWNEWEILAHNQSNIYDDWYDITGDFNADTLGSNNYYWIKGKHFSNGETKQVKFCYVPGSTAGKWELLAKRSSDTLAYALNNGLYVELDPWWDAAKAARWPIYPNGSTSLPVTFTSPTGDHITVPNNVSGEVNYWYCENADGTGACSAANDTTEHPWENHSALDGGGNSPRSLWDENLIVRVHMNSNSEEDMSPHNHPHVVLDSPKSISGQLGNSTSFDGSNDIWTFNDTIGSMVDNSGGHSVYTVSFWVNYSSLLAGGTASSLLGKYANLGTKPRWYMEYRSTDGTISGDCLDGSNHNINVCSQTNRSGIDGWYHHLYTYNGTCGTVYVNGTLESADCDASHGSCHAPDEVFTIGGLDRNDGTIFYKAAQIDEVMVWNISFTSEQAAFIYDNDALNYAGPGASETSNIAPTPTITTANNTLTSDSTPTIYGYCSDPDNGDELNATLWFNHTKKVSRTRITNGTSYSFTASHAGDGDWEFWLECFDNETGSSNSSVYNISIDDVPVVSLAMVDDTNTTDTNITIEGNYTDNHATASCELLLNGTGYGTYTASNATNINISANSSITEGIYDVVVECTTTFAGNSTPYQKRFDYTAPDINESTTSPNNDSVLYAGSAQIHWFKFNFTENVTEPDFVALWFDVGGDCDGNVSFDFYNPVNLSNVLSCQLSPTGQHIVIPPGNPQSGEYEAWIQVYGLQIGFYKYRMWVNDTMGHYAYTDEFTYRIVDPYAGSGSGGGGGGPGNGAALTEIEPIGNFTLAVPETQGISIFHLFMPVHYLAVMGYVAFLVYARRKRDGMKRKELLFFAAVGIAVAAAIFLSMDPMTIKLFMEGAR